MSYPTYTKRKFLGFEKKKQHKKCFELLRLAYHEFINNNDVYKDIVSHYNEIAQMLSLSAIETISVKSISDRFHFHLTHSSCNIKEHDLLPNITNKDTPSNAPFGDVAIYLDNLRSSSNIGSIIRTTEAMRIGEICFSPATPFIDNPKVIKTSMGTSDIVPCYHQKDLHNLPTPLIALETSTSAINIDDFIFPQTFTLVVGNEEYGVSPAILKEANYIINIPLIGRKNSINVACAYAIVANTIQAQKKYYERNN
jgi:tRNA G18 (ribose-2'-O)-methylase SpoU